jgi:hypothetical protein
LLVLSSWSTNPAQQGVSAKRRAVLVSIFAGLFAAVIFGFLGFTWLDDAVAAANQGDPRLEHRFDLH